jgi:hypothetical protein
MKKFLLVLWVVVASLFMVWLVVSNWLYFQEIKKDASSRPGTEKVRKFRKYNMPVAPKKNIQAYDTLVYEL